MTPRVHVICAADRPRHLRVLLAALRVQTFEAWRCTVLDQSGTGECAAEALAAGDMRISGRPVVRYGDWGQTAKWELAQQADEDYLLFPADDAYYAPPFLQRMVAALDGGLDLVYCDWVYDVLGYGGMTGNPRTGYIDVGGFMVRRTTLLAVGWEDRSHEGDGHLVETLVAHGARHGRVTGLYYVKN